MYRDFHAWCAFNFLSYTLILSAVFIFFSVCCRNWVSLFNYSPCQYSSMALCGKCSVCTANAASELLFSFSMPTILSSVMNVNLNAFPQGAREWDEWDWMGARRVREILRGGRSERQNSKQWCLQSWQIASRNWLLLKVLIDFCPLRKMSMLPGSLCVFCPRCF